jgi:hypothetical protein
LIESIVSKFVANPRQANSPGVDFLLVELETAFTFLDVADTTQIDARVERNHTNARRAYDTVQHLLPIVKPDSSQKELIEAKLAQLRSRLEGTGQVF